jgi:hypothetical protein
MMLIRIVGPKRDKVTGGSRNEAVKEDEMRNAYRILLGKPKGNTPLRRR